MVVFTCIGIIVVACWAVLLSYGLARWACTAARRRLSSWRISRTAAAAAANLDEEAASWLA